MIEEYEICNELKEAKEKELSNIISAKIKNGSSILKEMELAKIIQISAPQKTFWKMDFMIIDWH